MILKKWMRHGLRDKRAYRIWNHMLQRCGNPKDPSYSRYGGRGIKVCERWQYFLNFWEDMGEPPEGRSIDRIDNDGNYEPGNCRWATMQEQLSNRRVCRYVVINGERMTVTAAALLHGVLPVTALARVRGGWDPVAATTTRTKPRVRRMPEAKAA